MTQADAEDRLGSRIFPEQLRHYSRLRRHSRSGGKQNLVILIDLFQGDFVITKDIHLRPIAELSDDIYQIIGERVVVVEDEDFHLVNCKKVARSESGKVSRKPALI